MREQKKGNRVSWPSEANLCQVKYFQIADSPSKLVQQTCQLEASHSYHVVSDGGSANANLQIPQVQWRTPPEFVLRPDWSVAVGEESKEIEAQKLRETRVLEAVYPRLSAIPFCPLVSSDVESQIYDDRHTPIVPIIPVEDRAAMDLPSLETAQSRISIGSLPETRLQGPPTPAILSIATSMSVLSPKPSNSGKSAISYGSESKPVIATAAAANAILRSKESASLIDADLLIELLKNPEMTQKLVDEHRLSSKVSKAFIPLPRSRLLIVQSDDKNSKSADAGAEASRRPSSANVKTGTASEQMSIQPSLSLLRSTNDLLFRSSSHDHNQPANRGTDAATETLEQLLAANTRTGTGSRLKHVIMPLVPRTSTYDVLSNKCTRNQPVSSMSQIVTKPVQQSPFTKPETGAFSQSKQVAVSVPLSSSAPHFPSKKPTYAHGLANMRTMAMLKPVPITGYPPNTEMVSVSTSEHNQQTNTGNLVVPKPVRTQSVAADTSFGMGFRVKAETPLVSLPLSAHDFTGKKLTSEYNQQVNTENVVVSKPVMTQSVDVNTGSQTGFTTKTGIPPVSLQGLVQDLLGKISSSGQNQQVNTGNVGVPQPAVTQSVAAYTGTGTGFRIKTATPPVSLPSSVHDFPSKKSTNEHNQQADTGNVVLPKPAVTQSVAMDHGNGMGFGIKTVTLPWFYLTPRPYILGNNSSNEQYQPARTESVAVPRPLMPSLTANSTNGTGCRPTAVTPSVPSRSSIPDFRSNKPPSRPTQLANAVAGPVAEYQPLPIPRANVVSGSVAESQPPPPRINSELLGAPPNFGSQPVTKPAHSVGPNLDVSRLKKLIDEHGAHVQGGNASVAGINPTLPKTSKPDFEMLRKMISEHGSPNSMESRLPGSGPQLAPSSAKTFSRPQQQQAPSSENRQPQQPKSASFSASPYATPTIPHSKNIQFQQSLIKHRNRDHELLQQNKPQNYLQGSQVTQNVHIMESDQKIHKPCIYYSTSKGCRNGSRCHFQHELLKPLRSGGVLDAPTAKRMKPGGELTGEHALY